MWGGSPNEYSILCLTIHELHTAIHDYLPGKLIVEMGSATVVAAAGSELAVLRITSMPSSAGRNYRNRSRWQTEWDTNIGLEPSLNHWPCRAVLCGIRKALLQGHRLIRALVNCRRWTVYMWLQLSKPGTTCSSMSKHHHHHHLYSYYYTSFIISSYHHDISSNNMPPRRNPRRRAPRRRLSRAHYQSRSLHRQSQRLQD